MLLKPENDRFFLVRLITANPLKDSKPVMQGVGQDMNIGFVPGDQFAIQPDYFRFFQCQTSKEAVNEVNLDIMDPLQ